MEVLAAPFFLFSFSHASQMLPRASCDTILLPRQDHYPRQGQFPCGSALYESPTRYVPLPSKPYPREGEQTPLTSKHTRFTVGSHNELQRGCPPPTLLEQPQPGLSTTWAGTSSTHWCACNSCGEALPPFGLETTPDKCALSSRGPVTRERCKQPTKKQP